MVEAFDYINYQTNMSKYGYNGKLVAKEGQGNQLAELLLQASKLVTEDHGCHLYLVCQDANNDNIIWITEIWDTKEAHDASLKDDKVRQIIGQAMPILDSMPTKGQELKVLNAKF